jgi:hypothetical protein
MADRTTRGNRRKATTVRIDFRVSEEWVAELDAWRKTVPGKITRSQALRYMVEEYLKMLKAKKK